ncbi:hypothetical protein GCM10027447_00720 [Glycomyces halotolerans]
MTPTHEEFPRFENDYSKLTDEQRARYRKAVRQLVEDMREGRQPRTGLRVKRVQGCEGVYELSWAPDGRATWQYGKEQIEGEPHVIWRRVGTHDIFKSP